MDDEGTKDVTETDVDDSDDYVDEEPVSAELEEPDVLLDVPLLKVDEIALDVEDLRAKVSLQAEVLDLLRLNVGAYVELGSVHLDIKGVEAQALLKVRLDNVVEVIGRVLTTIDRNPDILRDVTSGLRTAVREVGTGAGNTLDEVGRGAGTAVEDVGRGAGTTVERLGDDTGNAVAGLAEQTGDTVKGAAARVGETLPDTEKVSDVPKAASGGATRARKAGGATGRAERKLAREEPARRRRAAEGGEERARRGAEAPRRKVKRVREKEPEDDGRPP
ncbi:hypothetical protein F7R91_07800 [Streptomyces luteolifulvus]|uniref:Uncharacterized protein n=1 Tax=Streptomyces luteolifulvus TaxID=2615112 RepID=A0A6H9V7B8_9ACTN|nr:hypothetical protein [Streptomyces luteolifulvus]KAB1148688.1 hypothetical protein F7R91_07800 [Streptomyces luteolifulvus]